MDGLEELKAWAQGFEDRRECQTLHDHYGDGDNGCGSRSCSQCRADFIRCALSDIERRVISPDTWKSVEADALKDAKEYCEERGIKPEWPKHLGKAKCEDLVRRCKALAERGAR